MNITEQVIELIADELKLKTEAVALDKALKDDLGVDSLEAVEMLMALEDKFKIVFDEKDHERVTTVQDIIDLVTKLVK
jgi:acyl carrier protein